jgi:glutamate racemase
MADRPLLFYDSGAGGLPYLAAARQRLPGRRLIYLADRKYFPFGEKPAELLRTLVIESVSLAVARFDPALIVIACNTASVVALEALRERFSAPFVGVVPAVKPAAGCLREGRIAVVATRQTASGAYLDRLIQDFAPGREVIRVAVARLVELAEYGYFEVGDREKRALVAEELKALQADAVQAVVLGCTHFVLLEREFRSVLPQGTMLVDSREGVTNRIVSLLEQQRPDKSGVECRKDADRTGRGRESGEADRRAGPVFPAELYLHGGRADVERYRLFARTFDLRFCGFLEEGTA